MSVRFTCNSSFIYCFFLEWLLHNCSCAFYISQNATIKPKKAFRIMQSSVMTKRRNIRNQRRKKPVYKFVSKRTRKKQTPPGDTTPKNKARYQLLSGRKFLKAMRKNALLKKSTARRFKRKRVNRFDSSDASYAHFDSTHTWISLHITNWWGEGGGRRERAFKRSNITEII